MLGQRDDADEIKRRLNERLEQLCDHFWPGNVKRGRVAYCAPTARKDDLGSFVVHIGQVGKYERGSWVRSSAGIGGDELNLFAYGYTGHHKATAEVFRAAREFVGLDDQRPETPAERDRRAGDQAAYARKREDDERRAREREQARTRSAGEIWSDSGAIAGTHAEAYLLARGIPVPPGGWSPSLRFHKDVTYDLDRALAFPTLICRVDDVFGELTAIWKIHLDPTKPAKAPVAKPKLGAGVAAGGAVRLGGEAGHIGIGEGIETCLAAAALIRYRFPVWAGLSTSGVAGFEAPMDVERITAFPDGDRCWLRQDGDIVMTEPPGRVAVRKLRERMASIGMKFDQQPEPKIGQDYLDIYRTRRAREVHA
jgi:hypothetical protein